MAFALLAIVSSPAHADFRVCNKTHALINIAVGTDAGEAFKTEGWWVATPGSCATPVRGPLKSRFVYLYATDIDGVDLVAGTATMCIDRGKFVAYGAENCWRRGLQAVTSPRSTRSIPATGRRSSPTPGSEDHFPFLSAAIASSDRRSCSRLKKSRVARFRARSSK